MIRLQRLRRMMMRSYRGVVFGLMCLAFVGCKKKESLRQDEQLKTFESERQLTLQEDEILAQRGSLQRERIRISDLRAEVAQQKLTLSEKDQERRISLEKEEARLASAEATI